MDMRQYKKINLQKLQEINDENQRKKLYQLIFNYQTSLLQARVDFKNSKINLNKLKIVVLDKLLRLNFSDNYIAFYDNNYYLLTEDEKKYIQGSSNENSDLTFIKNDLTIKGNLFFQIEIGGNNKYYLILKNEQNKELIFNFIRWVLTKNVG